MFPRLRVRFAKNETEKSIQRFNDVVSDPMAILFPPAGPYTEYRIIVIAFTLKYDGEPSDPVIQRTDIAGPSAPQIINLTCHSQDALYLQWKRPTTFYNSIDLYVINYKESTYNTYQSIQLNTTAAHSESAVSVTLSKLIFTQLQPNLRENALMKAFRNNLVSKSSSFAGSSSPALRKRESPAEKREEKKIRKLNK